MTSKFVASSGVVPGRPPPFSQFTSKHLQTNAMARVAASQIGALIDERYTSRTREEHTQVRRGPWRKRTRRTLTAQEKRARHEIAMVEKGDIAVGLKDADKMVWACAQKLHEDHPQYNKKHFYHRILQSAGNLKKTRGISKWNAWVHIKSEEAGKGKSRLIPSDASELSLTSHPRR